MGATDPGSAREEAERLVATLLATSRLAAAGARSGQWGSLGGIVASVVGHSGGPAAASGVVSPPCTECPVCPLGGQSPPCVTRVRSSPSGWPPEQVIWRPAWPACCARSRRSSRGRRLASRPDRHRTAAAVARTTTCGARPPGAGMMLPRRRNRTSGPPPPARRTRSSRPPPRPSTPPRRSPRPRSGRRPTIRRRPPRGRGGRGRGRLRRRSLTPGRSRRPRQPLGRRRAARRGEWPR